MQQVGSLEPYPSSPPGVPVAAATTESKGAVKVMMYHGLTYSRRGLCDPAVMPACVSQVATAQAQFMTWARLDPTLPSWDDVRFPLELSSGMFVMRCRRMPDQMVQRNAGLQSSHL